jgi:hypothetical protein
MRIQSTGPGESSYKTSLHTMDSLCRDNSKKKGKFSKANALGEDEAPSASVGAIRPLSQVTLQRTKKESRS